MGNQVSNSSPKRRSSRKPQTTAEQAAERAKRVVGDLQEGIKNSVKKLDDDHPAAQLLDHVCGSYYNYSYNDDDKYRNSRSASYYSEEASEDGSRTLHSEDDTTYDGRHRVGRKSDKSVDSQSYVTQSDYDSDSRRRGRGVSFDTEDESKITHGDEPKLISKPLASSFAKRCYFTKSGIGKTTQHYEGLTLTGNVVLMLASAMKLKGCPTICDEDLRRVEQTYPNQFSRLPDELLLSSGWRRISKYCHFSNKSIPDGIPFFHSKQRLHPSGGYYFLLAGSVGMVRPIDVEPLTKDTLVLLETDFPNQCDTTPSVLIRDPEQWVLVNKFCFFSGGPINTEEDVYYQADFDGNPIYMLAFLSPSLTPEELYKLTEVGPDNEPGLKSVVDVQEVESVYDLTERDFDDLKLYHLGPCRALPQYILQPSAWTKVLPPHFLAARQQAMLRAQDYYSHVADTVVDLSKPECESEMVSDVDKICSPASKIQQHLPLEDFEGSDAVEDKSMKQNNFPMKLEREVEEDSFHRTSNSFENDATLDQESFIHEDFSIKVRDTNFIREPSIASTSRMDPPDDEPPSLKIESMEENNNTVLGSCVLSDRIKNTQDIDSQGFFTLQSSSGNRIDNNLTSTNNFHSQYVSPASVSKESGGYFEGNDADQTTAIENTHSNDAQLPSSSEYHEENSAVSCNQYLNDAVGSTVTIKDDYNEHHNDQYGIIRQHHKDFVEETNELVEMDESYEEPSGAHENMDIVREQMPQLYPEENKFLTNSEWNNFEISSTSSNRFTEKRFHDTDEKKLSFEKEEMDARFAIKEVTNGSPNQETNIYSRKPIEPIDTSLMKQRIHHNGSLTPSDFSPSGISIYSGMDSRSHQSPAMRGAHEILKRNRRRRLEVLAKHSNNITPSSAGKPKTTKSENDGKEAWHESGSDITGSAVSGSSTFTDNSGPGDRGSRRALILQMAKARMKNNKESPVAAKFSSIVTEENNEADDTIFADGNGAHDIDLTGDLD